MDANRKKRLNELHEAYKRQPYSIEFDGFLLRIDKGVFPPDVSFATRKLGEMLKKYHPGSAIDIGSGCGYLAFVMKRNGASIVYATDINKTAVKCIKKNIERNIEMRGIKTVVSDLYQNIESTVKFDLIVFNHFYRPEGTGIFGPVHDGGEVVVTRFLKESKNRLNKNGVILMTFVKMSDPENDPKLIAQRLGYQVKIVHEHKAYRGTGDLYIYEISRKASNFVVRDEILNTLIQLETLRLDKLTMAGYNVFEGFLKIILYSDKKVAKKILKDKKIRIIEPRLRELWAKYEYQREKLWAKKILSSKNALLEIEKYPAFPFYKKLIKFEFAISNALLLKEVQNILFIGSGPLPLSVILLTKEGKVHVDGVDIVGEACKIGRDLARKLNLERCLDFISDPIVELNIKKYDVVILATLAGETDRQKRDLIRTLRKYLDKDQILVIRTVSELRSLLYPKIKEAYLKGFRVHFENSDSNIINSVIVAQKI